MNQKIKLKNAAILKLQNDARALHAEMEADESKRTADNREKLNKMIEDGKTLRAEIATLTEMDALSEGIEVDERKTADDPQPAGDPGGHFQRKSSGTLLVETAQFRSFAEGKTREGVRLQTKSLLGETALSGGETIRADRQTEIISLARQRPASVIDLVNRLETSLASVDYVVMTGRTDNAAIVAEGAAKPEGDLAFAVKTAAVKVIAEWIKASNRSSRTLPRLRGTVDTEIVYMLRNRLENVIIADMLAASGIQSRVHQVSGRAFVNTDTIADTLRRAITDIRLEFYEADGIVLHPTQGEALELLKDDNKQYVKVYDPVTARVWRVPVVETPAMTSGTAVVANFLLAYTVWDRMDAAVEVGYVNDDFTKNLVTILGELRAAYGTVRPKALEKITGM